MATLDDQPQDGPSSVTLSALLKIVGLVPLAILTVVFFGAAFYWTAVSADPAAIVFAIAPGAVVCALAFLGWKRPIAAGSALLLVFTPISFFVIAAIGFYVEDNVFVALLTVFVGLPLVSGLALLTSGIVGRRASRREAHSCGA